MRSQEVFSHFCGNNKQIIEVVVVPKLNQIISTQLKHKDMLSLNLSVVLHKLGNIYSDELKSCTDLCLYHPLKCGFGVSVLVIYFSMVSDSLLVAHLILFWASRCVIPSVLTPSMAEMMSPWARLPPTALLPGVIYGGGQQERSRLERQQENSSGHTHTQTQKTYADTQTYAS